MAAEWPQEPAPKKKVPHYYGDSIRMLFIAAAICFAVAMPIWGNLLPFGTLYEIGIVLVLAFLAGVTNPHSTLLMMLNVLAAGAGVFFLEAAAISFFDTDSAFLFIFREAVAIILLFAFYFAVKTLRSMMLGKVGALPKQGEFEKK